MAFIELDLRSGYLNSHEEVWMILPDEKPPKDGYPVLWLFHGAHQDCSEWVRNSSVERFANERGLAVIMPTMLHSYGMDMKYGADYFSMVTRELWPELHWMFPCLSQKKEKNFVAGASMGGDLPGTVCKSRRLCGLDRHCVGAAQTYRKRKAGFWTLSGELLWFARGNRAYKG